MTIQPVRYELRLLRLWLYLRYGFEAMRDKHDDYLDRQNAESERLYREAQD